MTQDSAHGIESDLAQLERLLEGAGIEVAALGVRARWEEFSRARAPGQEPEAGQPDPTLYEFVAHLHGAGLIPPSVRARLEFLNPQVVTQIETAAGLDETRAFPSERLHVQAAAHAPEPRARYEILDVLGEGGMGTVYLARDPYLLRQVALKTVRAGRASEAALARFVHEAQVTSQLTHPNVIPVHTLEFDPDGSVSYALELIRGQTLSGIIAVAKDPSDAQQAALDLPSRLEVFLKACDAVAYAHERGVLHRDLKPDNVMVGRHGEVYVLDWGLCKVADREGPPPDPQDPHGSAELSMTESDLGQTLNGSLVGTPRYMSPEHASGEPETIQAHSDQFALGLILFELVALEPALQAKTLKQVLGLARGAQLAPPPPGLPAELLAIVSKATALAPTERYPSVAGLGQDVRAFLRGRETLALPDDAWRGAQRFLKRHFERALAGAVLALLIAIAAAAGLVYRAQLESARADVARLEAASRDELLLSALAHRAERISAHFLFYEARIEGLAGATTYALLHGSPAPESRYAVEDFETPGRAPADLSPAPAYSTPISPTWPVYRVAPGSDPALAERELSRALSVRPHLLDLFASGPAGPAPSRDAAERRWRILRHEVPILWAEIGTAGAGVIVTFPGAAGSGWTSDYDPRTRPWYVEAVTAYRSTGSPCYWTAPYGDLMGEGLVITCSRVLLDPAGEVLGVTALDLSLKDVARDYLQLDPSQPVARATLVDQAGRVMLSSGDLAREAPFPDPELVAAVASGEKALGVARRGEGQRVLAWQRLALLDWTLIVETAPAD